MALHGRKLRISAAGKILYFMTRLYVAPQLLGQDFVVNFATYTRVYTVLQAVLVIICFMYTQVHVPF